AFASASLFEQVTGATAWHINADEPDVLDYDTSFKSAEQAALYSPDPYRSSDHDPVIVGLDLTLPVPPVSCEVRPSAGSLWPANGKLVPLFLDVDGGVAVTIDAIHQDEPVAGGGSGNTSPDAVIHADGTFELRAERDGGGNGRVYHVAFTLSDGFSSCSSVVTVGVNRSEEHTSELQSREKLVCRLLLVKKNTTTTLHTIIAAAEPHHSTTHHSAAIGPI